MTLQTLHLVLKTCLNFDRFLAGNCRSCGSQTCARASELPGHPEARTLREHEVGRNTEIGGPSMSATPPPRRKPGWYPGGVETFRDLRRVPMGKASCPALLGRRRLDLSDVLIDS